MGILALPDFAHAVPIPARLLGLDLGSKRLGLALSDAEQRIATPHKLLEHKKFTTSALTLRELIAQEHIGGLVIGLPRHMNGQEGRRAQSARSFAQNFLIQKDMPVYMQDERLSTQGAERALLAADLSRQKRAQYLDAAAAAWILQTTLDSLHTIRSTYKLKGDN